jgi:FkbM family methyltransferase
MEEFTSKIHLRKNYFIRLAKEVGCLSFLYRYSIRAWHKLIKANQSMLLPNRASITLPFDSKFGTEIFLKRDKLDWGSEKILVEFLDQNKAFIDAGANIGYYSLLAIRSSACVYAFEPDPRVLKVLRKNLEPFENAFAIDKALYSKPGSMQFSLSSAPEMNSLIDRVDGQEKISVQVDTLDAFMKENSDVNVSAIKTDVEGVDFEVLLGARNLIERDQPLILSELYPSRKVLNFCGSIGFQVFAFVRPKSVDDYRSETRFEKILERPKNKRVKMIFLVPPRLLMRFEEILAKDSELKKI